MNVFNDISSFRKSNTVVTIGIFDGVHRGHIEILNRLKQLSDSLHCETVVITLWPHPRFVLQPDNKDLRLLASLDEKIDLIEKQGIDNLIVLPFNRQLADITYDRFVDEYIVGHAGARYVVVGFNHHFGKDRKGTFENLKKSASEHGIGAERLDQVIIDHIPVSSSEIRRMIEAGRLDIANKLLGYPYFISGKVVEGNKIGRQLGFPTANIQVEEPLKLLPLDGVYAVMVRADDQVYEGMLNVGIRPTIDIPDHKRIIEVNLLGFHGDLYDRTLKIAFLERLREEKKFSTLDELKHQIALDQNNIENILSNYHNKNNLI